MSVLPIISKAAKSQESCNASTLMSFDAAVLRFQLGLIRLIRRRLYVGSTHHLKGSEKSRKLQREYSHEF